jgi:hypothetical protein
VRLDDIENWDAPHDDTAIDIEALQKILDEIEAQLDRLGLVVDFD